MTTTPKGLEEAKVEPSHFAAGDSKSMTGEVNALTVTHGETHRGLSSRHIQFLALGGCIGTGLFVGSGATLSLVGPAPLLMSYIAMSSVVWVVMNVLGEMSTYLPVKGVSVPYFVNRFTEPSLAFAVGYNYWYSFSMLIASEVTAAALIIEYWTEAVPVAAWITIILVVILVLNVIAVSFFGEAEFWFASIKIIAILGLIILGIVLFFGGGPNHDRLGFRYWVHPGAFNPYLVGGATGRFLGFWTAFIRSGFSFIFSPELITTAAGEATSPRRNIPKATKRFIYRLFAFYILGSLVVGVTVAYNDPDLLSGVEHGGHGAGASPFVIGIQKAGIKGLNHVINAAILTSAWSSGNSWLYAGSRTLYSLALCLRPLHLCDRLLVVPERVQLRLDRILLVHQHHDRWGLYLVDCHPDCVPAIPRCDEIPGPAPHHAFQDASAAVRDVLCAVRRVPADPDERLCGVLPGPIHRVGLPGVVSGVCHLPGAVPGPQAVVPDAVDDQGVRGGCAVGQGGDRPDVRV